MSEERCATGLGARFMAELRPSRPMCGSRGSAVADGGRSWCGGPVGKDAAIRKFLPASSNSARRSYFRQTFASRPVRSTSRRSSSIREGDVGATPPLPVLRVATPVHGPDGQLFGS